jgi:glycosyltransferase involved in cell wall biosynthesis
MITICIPIYNCDVGALVNELIEQAQTLDVEYELLLIDDASETFYIDLNASLSALTNVRYIQLETNIGRSAIRNMLAREATYRYLIFMDCDARCISPHYLKNYLNICTPDVVCYGGKANLPVCPSQDRYLRWFYSVKREQTPAAVRSLTPNRSFITFNFLIDKELFDAVKFDETLTGYGHEDTLFGIRLSKHGIIVRHIDNQLMYCKLDTAEAFIRKTEQGIRNLLIISDRDFVSEVKLLRAASRLHKLRLTGVIALLFKLLRKYFLRNLTGTRPSLAFFDFYKLGYLCSVKKQTPSGI